MKTPRFAALLFNPQNFPTPLEAVRTTLAAVGAVLLADLLHLANGYWAAISCLIVVLSSAGSELAVSVRRCAGTALGAGLAAGLAHFWATGPGTFAAAVLLAGLVCWVGRLDRAAFRYGSIAAAIVLLVPHTGSAGPVALHRFIEVSLGIAVGLATATVWPQRPARPPP